MGRENKAITVDLFNLFLMSVGLFKSSHSKFRSVSLLLHSNFCIRNLEFDSLAFSFYKVSYDNLLTLACFRLFE